MISLSASLSLSLSLSSAASGAACQPPAFLPGPSETGATHYTLLINDPLGTEGRHGSLLVIVISNINIQMFTVPQLHTNSTQSFFISNHLEIYNEIMYSHPPLIHLTHFIMVHHLITSFDVINN